MSCREAAAWLGVQRTLLTHDARGACCDACHMHGTLHTCGGSTTSVPAAPECDGHGQRRTREGGKGTCRVGHESTAAPALAKQPNSHATSKGVRTAQGVRNNGRTCTGICCLSPLSWPEVSMLARQCAVCRACRACSGLHVAVCCRRQSSSRRLPCQTLARSQPPRRHGLNHK